MAKNQRSYPWTNRSGRMRASSRSGSRPGREPALQDARAEVDFLGTHDPRTVAIRVVTKPVAPSKNDLLGLDYAFPNQRTEHRYRHFLRTPLAASAIQATDTGCREKVPLELIANGQESRRTDSLSGALLLQPSDLLRLALESVLARTYQDFEIVLADAASDFDVGALAASFVDPRIHVYRSPTNLGIAGNYFSGFRIARGTYVAHLDDDDMWEPQCLLRHARTQDARVAALRSVRTHLTLRGTLALLLTAIPRPAAQWVARLAALAKARAGRQRLSSPLVHASASRSCG